MFTKLFEKRRNTLNYILINASDRNDALENAARQPLEPVSTLLSVQSFSLKRTLVQNTFESV